MYIFGKKILKHLYFYNINNGYYRDREEMFE